MHGRRQMSQKSVNGSYWQTPPGARNQILLLPISLEEKIHDTSRPVISGKASWTLAVCLRLKVVTSIASHTMWLEQID